MSSCVWVSSSLDVVSSCLVTTQRVATSAELSLLVSPAMSCRDISSCTRAPMARMSSSNHRTKKFVHGKQIRRRYAEPRPSFATRSCVHVNPIHIYTDHSPPGLRKTASFDQLAGFPRGFFLRNWPLSLWAAIPFRSAILVRMPLSIVNIYHNNNDGHDGVMCRCHSRHMRVTIRAEW
jgi:hypothetical protein